MGEDAPNPSQSVPSGSLIGDLGGLGALGKEIVGALGAATGVIWRPRSIRAEGIATADVEAYAIESRARAEAKARLIADDAEQALAARAVDRLRAREMHRQETLEGTVEAALRMTWAREDSTSRPLEPDWTNAFIDHAQEISDESLRKIWARILVQQSDQDQPAVSRATLDSIRLLERSMALEFERLFRAWVALGQIMDLEDGPEGAININAQDALALTEIGLLRRESREESNIDVADLILSFHWGTRYRPEISAEGHGTNHPLYWQAAKIRIDRLIPTWRGQELGSVLFPDLYPRMSEGEIGALAPAYESPQTRAEIVFNWADDFRSRGWEVVLNEVKQRTDIAQGGGTLVVPSAVLEVDKGVARWRDLEAAEIAAIIASRA